MFDRTEIVHYIETFLIELYNSPENKLLQNWISILCYMILSALKILKKPFQCNFVENVVLKYMKQFCLKNIANLRSLFGYWAGSLNGVK